MQKTLSTLKDKINNALVVDRENYIYRCHRSIFTDPQLFEFEMKHIFETRRLPRPAKIAAFSVLPRFLIR